MSDAKHTAGRLHHLCLMGSTEACSTRGQSIFHCGLGLRHNQFGDEQEQNARRLVAAWNASIDVPTEVLEANSAGGLPWSVADQIDRGVERDELLAALQAVMADGRTMLSIPVLDTVMAAIAKATGGAA